ncbi:MAG: DUF6259 domain-containing protein [Capsulimonadaceae bacterium]
MALERPIFGLEWRYNPDMRNLQFIVVALVALMAWRPCLAGSGAVRWANSGETLTGYGRDYGLTLDAGSGAPIDLAIHGARSLKFARAGWWTLVEAGGKSISAADCSVSYTRHGDTLRYDYRSTDTRVLLTVTFRSTSVDLRARVSNSAPVAATRFALPTAVTFDGGLIHHVYFPEELGRSLEPSFFQPGSSGGYLSVEGDYPPLFSDFLHLDLDTGQVSVYMVRDRRSEFVPAHLSAGGVDGGGRIGREWIVWIAPGQTWTSPVARIAVGAGIRDSLLAYVDANGYTRPLSAKIKPKTLAVLEQSMLIKYSGDTLADQTRGLGALPRPVLLHIWNYLHGGFDKQYPDHLPPNPQVGTEGDLATFFATAHRLGDLVMPYTNPTWWCDDPRGPTFLRDGDAPLLRDQSGHPVREIYGPNDGWSLSTFHPDAIAAEQTVVREFTHDYPSDLLFQDQIGARSPKYDFNPAAHDPNSYLQGLQDIASRTGRVVPVATENGYDGVLNDETEMCGLCWSLIPTENPPSWVQLWRDRYPAGSWRLAPMALWMAHDKTVFAMHDLGQFTTSPEILAWDVALGYQLSANVTTDDLTDPARMRWLAWLAAVQRTVGPLIIGRPLTDWQEPSPGVYRAVYGDTVVLANTRANPFDVDAVDTLAAHGFSISTPNAGVIAGSFQRWNGKLYPQGNDFVR